MAEFDIVDLTTSVDFGAAIDQAIRAMHAQVELAVRELMAAENLSEADLRERCTWLSWPDGRQQITLDGKPRIEWGPPSVTTTDKAGS